MKFYRAQGLIPIVLVILLMSLNVNSLNKSDQPTFTKVTSSNDVNDINNYQAVSKNDFKNTVKEHEEIKSEIERLSQSSKGNKNNMREEEEVEDLSPNPPPTISEELKKQEMESFRFSQSGSKAAPPKGLMRDANPFMLNTEHLLKKPPANPQDYEVEVVPRSANSQTHYSWGFWPFRVSYSAFNALKGRLHSKWLSKQHALDDHWEAVFKFPQKLDSFDIVWTNPPERMRVWFKLDDSSSYIPLTDLITKYKKIDDSKLNSKENVSYTDAFVFHKPIFAKRLRISMNKPLKQEVFGIDYVRFYEKRTVVLIRNHKIFPDKQLCMWINNHNPQEFDRIELIDCIEAIQFGDNRELWVYYTDKTIRHYISQMCIGFNEKMEICLRKCYEVNPAFKIMVNTDGSLGMEDFEDKLISANTQDKNGQNFVNPQTEIVCSSQADGSIYRKENITVLGDSFWMSRPGTPVVTMQILFGKELKGYKNLKVDVIRIDWVSQPKDFIIYSWRPGSSWVMQKKFKDLSAGVGTTTVQLLGEEFSSIMIYMARPNQDKNGTYSYAIGNVFIGCNAMTLAFVSKNSASTTGTIFDFDIQYNLSVVRTQNYMQSRDEFALMNEKMVGGFRRMMRKMSLMDRIKEKAIGHKLRLDIGMQYLKENAHDKLQDFVNNALDKPTNAMFMNQVAKFAAHSEYSGLLNKSEGMSKIGSQGAPAEDCLSLKKMDASIPSGFFYIQPECAMKPIRVFCDFGVYGAALDIFIENDENLEPDPDLKSLGVRDKLDVREICAKRGLEPIQIHNSEMISRILLLLKTLGYTLKEGKVIPIAYDYSCERESCIGNFNSINEVNSIPVNTFAKIVPMGAIEQPNMAGFGEATLSNFGPGNPQPPLLFKFQGPGSNLAGLVCSTNHTGSSARDGNVIEISCQHNVSNNGDLFPIGRTVLVKCPPGCNVSPGIIYGVGRYHGMSMICKSAIHNNKMRIEGGKIYVNVIPSASSYNAMATNGIPSEERPGDQDKSFTITKFNPQCKYDMIQQLRLLAPRIGRFKDPRDPGAINVSLNVKLQSPMNFVQKMSSYFSSFLETQANATPVNNNQTEPNQSLGAQKLNTNQLNGNINMQQPQQQQKYSNSNLQPQDKNMFQNYSTSQNQQTPTQTQTNINEAQRLSNANSQGQQIPNINQPLNSNTNSNLNNSTIQPNQESSQTGNQYQAPKQVHGYYPQPNSGSLKDLISKHQQPSSINFDPKDNLANGDLRNGYLIDSDFVKANNFVPTSSHDKTFKADTLEHAVYREASNMDILNLRNEKPDESNTKHDKPQNEIDMMKVEHEHVSYIDEIPTKLKNRINKSKEKHNKSGKTKTEMKKLLEEKGQTMKEEALDLIDEKDLEDIGLTKKRVSDLKKQRYMEESIHGDKKYDMDINGKILSNPNNKEESQDEFSKLRFAEAKAKAGVSPGTVAQAAAASGIEKAIKTKIENGVMNLFGLWDPLHTGYGMYGHTGVGLNGELNGDAHLAAQVMGLGDAVTSGALGGNNHTTEGGANINIGIGTDGHLTVGGPGYAGQLMGERGQMMEGANYGVALGSRGASAGKVGDPRNSAAYKLAGDALFAAQAAARGLNVAGAGGGVWAGANPTLGAGYGLGGRLGVGSGRYAGAAGGFGAGAAGAMGAGRGAVGIYDTPGHYQYGGSYGRGGGGGGGGGAYGMGAAYGYGKGGVSAFVNYSVPGSAKMGYNQGKGIGATTLGSGHGGFYGGYEGGFNNDLPMYNGKFGINGEDASVSGYNGFGEAGFDPEWGDHEENTGDWDISWDSGSANAKPPPEPFIPKDVVDEPPRTSIPQVPSTERALKGLDLIYEEHDRKGHEYWKKMNKYIEGQRDKTRNNISWSQKGGPYGVESITEMTNKLKANCQKFKSYLSTVENKAKAKKKRTQSIVNGFKEKLRDLTKSDGFTFNFNGPPPSSSTGVDGTTESGGSTTTTTTNGGGGGTSTTTEGGTSTTTTTTENSTSTTTITTTTKQIMEKCIKDAIDGGSSGGGGGKTDGNAKENFKLYFENRFDNFGDANFDFTTDNIKGRKSAVCSGGTQAAGCDSITKMMPSNNLAANVIVIKNKSYFDFDLTVDVLFRQPTKAGIAFKMRDQYNYYAFMIDVPNRTKQLIKVTDGRVKVLKKIEDGGVILNDWHSIHITTTYSNMKIFIYDAETIDRKSTEKIIEYYDNSFVEGQIGIIVGTSEGFCYDKLKVTGKVVWTPWIPRKGITIIQKTSGVFAEDGYDSNDPAGSETPSEWGNKTEDGFGGDTGLIQNSDICDSSENKLPAFITKKGKILNQGTMTTSFVPPQTCIEGIVSVIIKYSKVVSKSGQATEQYYMFEMINSSSGNVFRLRKYLNGSVKDIRVISNPNELPNLPFSLGFTPELEHKVVITTNGTILTILLSVNNSSFVKILQFKELDIKSGQIGVGTCKCKARFSEISMRPPQLTLSEEDKKKISSGTSTDLVAPKGAWEVAGGSSEGNAFVTAATNDQMSESSTDIAAVDISGGGSSSALGKGASSQVTAAVEEASSEFEASSSSSTEFSSVEVLNQLEQGSSSNESSVEIREKQDGTIEVRGWSDSGFSSQQENIKTLSKEFIAGWETCVVNRTTDRRNDYCSKITSDPFKKQCYSDFCSTCCEINIPDSNINTRHQCTKICFQSTAYKGDIDVSSNCLDSPTQQNVYSYCQFSFSGKPAGFIEKCKLDMCNLCCATVDAILDKKTSNKAEALCLQKCSSTFNKIPGVAITG